MRDTPLTEEERKAVRDFMKKFLEDLKKVKP